MQLQETQACLLTKTDKVLHIVGNKMKIDLGNGNTGIAGECTIIDKKNPINSFLNERITDKLPIEGDENLSVTQLKIIYFFICFPNIKYKEIAYLLCALPSTIYRETQNIKEKLGAISRDTLTKKC